MISKRIEDREEVDVQALFRDLQERLELLRKETYADA
jgi:hypothetical protein